MRFHWLLPSIISVFLVSTSAQAARLQSWRFDSTENRLYITTDDGVQPKAQLLFNPTRLVIDLPGTTYGKPQMTQPVGGAIRAVRAGQFDGNTTRLVIELNSGYTIDPQQVIVRGQTASEWTVQIPEAQPIAATAPQPPQTTAAGLQTTLNNVRVTGDGLFLDTRGTTPEVNVQQSSDRSTVNIDLQNTTLTPRLQGYQQIVNRNNIGSIQIGQIQTSPPVARITLNVTDPNKDWRATANNNGKIIILPEDTTTTTARQPQISDISTGGQLTTIQSVEMTGSQMVIRTDGPFTYTSGWDRASGYFQITIPAARIGAGVRSPQTNALRVALQQADPNTVVIWVQPAAGVQLSELNQPSNQMLALQLQAAQTPPPNNTPEANIPRIPSGRLSVVVDPGHGGGDPGAVGIGGIRETDIVLDISYQVAQMLEQNGIQAILTRTDDREIELQPRVQLAERINATLFVSIHANAISMSRPDVNGIETFYYSSGIGLARSIQSNLLAATGANNRGVKQANFYVLRKTTMPAVLVEVGFVTGAQDAARMADPAYRRLLAEGITRGILQYIQQNRY
ncbi:N-acetylmuramoyl-L-alanine amidase [Ancylothrix sp. C2]|nr:N-acetylmuramoyl-L-alanine amidase [Ancylothrix sp. D3o]MCT7950410.1 N-acetylmuramoyl-L-alanine amidase [Ancylothrix sp. D3o]